MPNDTSNLNFIVKTLGEELTVDVCSLYILTNDNHQLKLAATHGLSQSVIGATMSIKQGLTGVVARTCRSLSVKNPDTHPDYFHIQGSGEEKYQSYLGIPLVKNESLLGVLVVQTIRPKLFFMSEIKSLYAAGYRLIDILSETESTHLPGIRYA